MTIKDLGNGTFQVSYSKKHPLTKKAVTLIRKATSLAQAKRTEHTLIAEVNNRIQAKTNPKVGDCRFMYLEEREKNSTLLKSTQYSEGHCLKKHTSKWDKKNIDEITTADITQVITIDLASKTLGTKRFMLKCIRAFMEFAVQMGFIKVNPTPSIGSLRLQAPEKKMLVLNEGQLRTLLNQARDVSHRWYPVWAMAVYTGMRSGELFALKWENVDLENRKLHVCGSWSSKDGFKDTKSGDDRILEIAEPLIPLLNELKTHLAETEFVLPRIPAWCKGEQARVLRGFLKLLGLPEVRFHDLRASWATLLLSKGVAPAKVMAMGGWKDMETMMIYMRKSGIDIKGATDCLADLHSHTEIPIANVISLFGRNDT